MAKDFTHTDYYSAAFDREKDLDHLLTNKNCIIFSMYCAGVIIECILRAYCKKNEIVFDAKHNLDKLLFQSGLSTIISKKDLKTKNDFTSAVKISNRLWNNDLRYNSEKRVRRKLGGKISTLKNQGKQKDFYKYLYEENKELFKSVKKILKIIEPYGFN